jgi:predicted GNAT superfamily acetyltransferase
MMLTDQEYLAIEIPANINALQSEKPRLAVEWRHATRWGFTAAMSAGYLVGEFYRSIKRDQPIGVYLLNRGTKLEHSNS